MSAINERVSDERIANLIEVLSFYSPEDKHLANNESELASALHELQQYRAAAERPIGSFHIVDQQVGGATDYVKDGEWPIDNGELLVYAAPQVTSVPQLAVWYGSMPESNGKTNWTAILYRKGEGIQDGFTIDRSEYPDRVRYAADRVRYLIGEIAERPYILNYDADEHSGYTAAPAVQAEQLSGNTEQVSQPTLPATHFKPVADLYALKTLSGQIYSYTASPHEANMWLGVDGYSVQEFVKLERLQEAITGNSTAIPDGYALVPVEPLSVTDAEHVASVLEMIGSFEPDDIDSDSVDLRFELDGLDTGSDVYITEYATRGAAIIRQLSGNTEQVSQPYTLPADYLQGHKDGCEWAARMAEANHPQTGDWLFDDPIELAKAIRKGPDMLPVEPGNSPVIPDGSEDSKRLDWLDEQNKRLNKYYGTSYGWKFDANFQRNAMMLNDSNYPVMTVRQAIDEAIAAAPKQDGE